METDGGPPCPNDEESKALVEKMIVPSRWFPFVRISILKDLQDLKESASPLELRETVGSGNIPHNIPQNTSQNIPQNITQNIPQNVPQNIPPTISKNIPRKRNNSPGPGVPCHLCPRRLKNEGAWIAHLKSHQNEVAEPFACTLCPEAFDDHNEFKYHLVTSHPKDYVLFDNPRFLKAVTIRKIKQACPTCSQIFASHSDLTLHLTTYPDHKPVPRRTIQAPISKPARIRPFKCSLCPLDFVSEKSLSKHSREFHKIFKERFKKSCICLFCGYDAKRPNLLARHNRIHTGEKPFTCDKCGFKFAWENNFKVHVKTCTGVQPQMRRGIFAGQKYKCSKCNYKCSGRKIMDTHEKLHGDKFMCELCPAGFSGPFGLSFHKRKQHPNDPNKFTCMECGKGFPSQEAVRKHKQHAHQIFKEKSQKSCICLVCGYDAKMPNQLVRHNRIHTGEKPFECDTCGYKFAWENNLKVHVKTCTGVQPQLRRGNFERKMYKCSKCNYKCWSRKVRDTHEEVHGDKFMCELCPTGFSGPVGLSMHKRMEHPNDPNKFICGECGKGFPTKDDVRKHKEDDHQVFKVHVKTCTEVKPQIRSGNLTKQVYKCSKCNYKCWGRKIMDIHEKIHGDKFMCELCPAGFSGPVGLSMHKKMEHPDDPNKFICTECGKGFPDKEAVLKHKEDDHQIFKPKSQKSCICLVCGYDAKRPNLLARHNLIHTQEKPFTCDTCGFKFAWENNLNVHVKNCTGVQPEIREGDFERQMYNCSKCNYKCWGRKVMDTHEKVHGDKFMCELCPTGFSGPVGLSMHKKMEHPDDPNKFICTECGKGFPEKDDVREHKENDHPSCKLKSQKPCICLVCGYNAKKPNRLAQHNRIHTGERPYECNTCGYKFAWENSLKVHVKTCTGVQPQIRSGNFERKMYKCSKCNYKSWGRKDRDRHEKLHGDKFMCELCPAGFSSPFGLSMHKRKEHPNDPNKYTCTECGKGFPAKEAVRKHKQVDHGIVKQKSQKPQKSCICLVCGYDAKKPNLLVRHNRVHTGEKPYECDTCGTKFRWQSNLKAHAKICTGLNTHIKRENFTRQMYKCSKCNYKSRGRLDRDRHEKLHGDKFVCELCPAGFSGPFGLSIHKRMEHPNDPNKFTCTECGKGFPAKKAVRKHRQVDHKIFLKRRQTSCLCLFCGYDAKTPHQLAQHNRVHTGEKPYECNTCGFKFAWKKSHQTHEKSCTGVPPIIRRTAGQMYKCSKCNYKCKTRRDRDTHEKVHGDKFMCELCPTGFSGPVGLSMHKKMEHPDDPNKFVCTECGKGFPAKDDVREHKENDHQIFKLKTQKACICLVCGYKAKRPNLLARHNRIHTGEMYKCSKCNYKCLDRKVMDTHEKVHGDKFMCELCPTGFSGPVGLSMHKKMEHPDDPNKFICTECGKGFPAKKDVLKHKEDDHQIFTAHVKTCTGVQPQIRKGDFARQMYKCSKCNYKCWGRKVWKTHEKVHGDKFMCELCPTGFSGPVGLSMHKKMEHPDDPNKFICTECGKGFPEKEDVRKHKQDDHQIFKVKSQQSCICLVCGYDAKKPNRLAKHNRVHTGERPFTCDTCGSKFRWENNFKVHVKGCTGVNTQIIRRGNLTRQMYKCSKCNYKCRNRKDRDRHEMLHGDKFMCELCPAGFSGPFGLSMHKRKEHPNDPNKFTCAECGKGFPAKMAVRKHRQVDHGIFKTRHQTSCFCLFCGYDAKTPHNLAQHNRIHTGEKPYECDKCGFKFAWKNNFNVHVKNCTGVAPVVRTNCAGQMYKCSKCNYKCKNRKDRDIHEKVHGDKFMCELCPAGFSGPFGLSMHKRKEHPNDKNKFTCTECGKGFISKRAVREHKQVSHADLKQDMVKTGFDRMVEQMQKKGRTSQSSRPPEIKIKVPRPKMSYICAFCGYDAKRSYVLTVHVRTHTGEKPFSCEFCGKRFSMQSSRRIHLKSCQKNPESKPVVKRSKLPREMHKCSKCNYKSMFRRDRNVHEKVHGNKHFCKICPTPVGFKHAYGLANHKKLEHPALNRTAEGNERRATLRKPRLENIPKEEPDVSDDSDDSVIRIKIEGPSTSAIKIDQGEFAT